MWDGDGCSDNRGRVRGGFLVAGFQHGETWAILIGTFFCGVAPLSLFWHDRFEFDRDAGLMRTRRLCFRRGRPLREVLAVQLIYGEHGDIQLNLVLDDERQRRMNLTARTNWEATRSDGAELARFLGVPLLNDASPKNRKGKPGESDEPGADAEAPAVEPSQPKQVVRPQAIRIGSREFTPDTSPLPIGERGKQDLSIVVAWGFPTIVQTSSHSLVIRRSARSYGCLLLTVPLGTAGTVFFATAAAFPDLRARLVPLASDKWPTWLLVILAVFSLLWLAMWNIRTWVRQLFVAGRVRFDTSTGLMTFGPVWSRQRRPLSQIVAVQVLSNIFSPFRASPTKSITNYQVNLVLDDVNTPRINVAVSGERARSQEAGKQLADFLGVPLVNLE